MLHEQTGIPFAGQTSPDQFIKSRSGSIQDKVRKMLQNDLILKAVSGFAFIIDLLFYRNNPEVLYVLMAGIVLLIIMATLQWKTLQEYNRISDHGLPTRESLSSILVFLRRKSVLFELIMSSSQILIFVPGLLAYFFLTYGYLKPMTGFSFFVFSSLCLIGTIMSFLRTRSQLNFHIKHITICLSDLNENSLEFASRTIEKQARQDNTMKLVVGLLLIFGFVVLIAVLKSIV